MLMRLYVNDAMFGWTAVGMWKKERVVDRTWEESTGRGLVPRGRWGHI